MNLSTVKWTQWDKTQSRELLGLFICVCTALCTIVVHNIVQNRADNFPLYPPYNHHCSDDVYLREGGGVNWSRCHLGCELGWAKEVPCIRHGSRSPDVKGKFWGRRGDGQDIRTCVTVNILKVTWQNRCRLGALDGMHIGTTCRMWLNRTCAALMRPYVELLWPLVVY